MRVLFLTHRLPYAPNRGDRIRAWHLLRALSGHAEIDLVSLVHDDEEAGHVGELGPLVASITVVRVNRARNLARAMPALLGQTPLTHVLLDSAGVRPALQRVVVDHRPNIVLAYCSGMAQYLFAPELRDFPAVLDMVDVDSDKWADLARTASPPRGWVYRREARLLRTFERRACGRACATLVVNEREHRSLASIAPLAHLRVVGNGIDAASFAPPAGPTDQPVAVFCGVMDYQPNVEGACWIARQVWPEVRKVRPDARLFIVGSAPVREVRELERVCPGITVTGQVPDVRPYLWNAALAVAPIWVARGLQNKVLEALAAGLPAVVTPPVAGGLSAAVLAGCRSADDPSQFAVEVLDLFSRTGEERRALARRAAVAALDWPTQLRPAIDLLRECAQRG